MNPALPTLEQARATLKRSEALISALVLPERTFVWALPQNGPVAFAAVPLGITAIESATERLRKALDPNSKTVGEIPDFDVAMAYELYRTLLEPVAAGWKDAENLIIVVNGPLAQLPFSLLVTKPM